MNNLDKVAIIRQLQHINDSICGMLKTYVFSPYDPIVKKEIEDLINSYLTNLPIANHNVSCHRPFVLWGMVDGELVDPCNPESNPIIICEDGFIYDIENDCFLTPGADQELLSEVREAVNKFDLDIKPIPDNKFTVDIDVELVVAPGHFNIEFTIDQTQYE